VNHGRIALALMSALAAVAVTAALCGEGGRDERASRSESVCRSGPSVHEAMRISARGAWKVAVRGRSLVVLTREPSRLLIVDASTGRVTRSVELDFDPWDLALGHSSAWVTPNGGDGRLRRVDLDAGRVRAVIDGGRIALANFVAAGYGRVWTGNSDERLAQGRSVSMIDPQRNRVIGRPTITSSDVQGLAPGFGAVWVADHSAGEISRLDARTGRVSSRVEVGDAPHEVALGAGSVWAALSHVNRVARVDPDSAAVSGRSPNLGFAPLALAAGGSDLWIGEGEIGGTPARGRLLRLDARTLRPQAQLDVGEPVADIAVADGAAWAALWRAGAVLKVC
jgi:hypothetical protein